MSEEDKIKLAVKKQIANERRRNMAMNSPFGLADYGYDDEVANHMFPMFGGDYRSQVRQPSPEEQARLEEDRL